MIELTKMRDDLPLILKARTWITEQEGDDVTSKLTEIRGWFEDQIDAQDKVNLWDTPAFTME
jgi:hypothetical protein